MEDTDDSKEETLAIILKKLAKNEESLNKRLDSLTKEITTAKRENYEHFTDLQKKMNEYEKSRSFLSNQYKSQKKTTDNLTKENILMKVCKHLDKLRAAI